MHPPVTPAAAHSPNTPAMLPPQYGNVPTPRRGYTVTGPQLVRAIGPGMASPPRAGCVRPYGEVFGGDPRVRYGPMPPTPGTPDPKRRRFKGNEVYIAGRREGIDTPYLSSPRRMSLPRPEAAHHPPAIVGPAPPRAAYQQRHGAAQVSPPMKHDPNLTLAPLKTQGPSRAQQDGVEAMIKSINVLNKIKILNQAAPPLATPGPATPPHEIRGAILAIEGLDAAKVAAMAQYLTEELVKNDRFSVKTFSGPEFILGKADAGKTCPLHGPENFLQTIGSWHKISRDMCKFITNKPGNTDAMAESSDVGDKSRNCSCGGEESTESKDAEMSDAKTDKAEVEETLPVSPRTILPETEALSIKSPKASKDSEAVQKKGSLPIAIVPRYQLTTVDASAIGMPITDSYSVVDHWNWLAALWRGCVGPDVTIVVQARADLKGSGENWDANGTHVDVRLREEKTVIVKVGKDDEIDEKALRRVGFEVEEFLRR